MKSNDIEWRKAIREYYKMSNLMPEMYADAWRTQEGQKIALKITLRRTAQAIAKPLQAAFRKLKIAVQVYLYNYGQNLCAKGVHKWSVVSAEQSVNSHSKLIRKSCKRCPAVKVVRR